MRPRSAVVAALILLSWTCAEAQTTGTARIVVKSARLTDNGDNDGFADPHETVSLFLTLRNVSPFPRSGVKFAITTNDPRVDCVLTSVAAFGSLDARQTREAPVPVSFRVAGVARATLEEELTATFDVLIWGDDFDLLSRPQQVTVDLDLNVSGGLLPTSYTEGFEAGTFGTFTTMSLDTGKASLALSDGHRCQYNDPDFANSNSYGNTFCFLGFPDANQNGYDWHVHGLSSPDGGRAYLGNNSLHWGMHPSATDPGADTTRLKQLDAIRTTNPVNLGWNGVTSELHFKHQVGLTDSDFMSGPPLGTVDRGIVQIQLAGSTGTAVGNWRKIFPYENLYDTQTMDNYTNCQFDPTDDGTTEDDYFYPSDTGRRFGPSSTCYPEFSFTRLGAIFWSDVFDPADIHHASDGPGLQGSLGPGTWVESKFDLARYRGRRLRLRFLVSTIEIGTAVTQDQALQWNTSGRGGADDGWYVDDVQISNTTIGASTVTVDTADRSALPGCPAACSSLSASLAADPNPSSVPGEPILLDASGSTANSCPGGFLYRFWQDRDDNGVLVGYPEDELLRGWTDDPTFTAAPRYTGRYVVEVQCASRVSCAHDADVLVTVPCVVPHLSSLRFSRCGNVCYVLSWDAPAAVDVLRGDLDALRASGGDFEGTVTSCGSTFYEATVDYTNPNPGAGVYYLVREAGPVYACSASWGTGSPAELPGAGGDRDTDLALDPEACP